MVSIDKKKRNVKARDKAYRAQDGLCFYCRERMWTHVMSGHNSPKMATSDHIIPLSQGGDWDGLIVAACQECNVQRGSMPWLYFVAIINERKLNAAR